MSRTIIKIQDWYLVWSSIVDAPICCCQEEELPKAVMQFFGTLPAPHIDRMLERLKTTGSGSLIGTTVDAIISCNRAGPHEKRLTRNEIYRAYCLKERIGDWSAYRDEDHNPT